MTIKEFECVGHKYLALKDITSVTMKPEQKLQMILGTSGSGKSTIMGELSLLAASKQNYTDKGYKRIVQETRGSVYEGISDFRGVKNHFCLTKDDVVIYSGHSSEAYNSHVFTEVKMTQEIHDIRTGKKRLSNMDKESRRKWFTHISPEDYTYAIAYYKRLASATRDISGTINRLNQKLMQETAKLINEEDETRMRLEIKELSDQRKLMMQHWRPTEDTVGEILDKVNDIDKTLESMADDFTKSLRIFCNAKGYASQADIWADIAKSQGQLTYLDSKINETIDIIESNREKVDIARVAMNQDITALSKELAEVSRELLGCSLNAPTDREWKGRGNEALITYDTIYNNLTALVGELVSDQDHTYTSDRHLQREQKISQCALLINSLEDRIKVLNENISIAEHRKLEGHTECPKCNHVWSRGFDETVYEHHRQKRNELLDQLDKAATLRETLVEEQEASSHQLSLYNQIGMLARNTNILEPMWLSLNKDKLLRRNPQAALILIKGIRVEIENSILLSELETKCQELSASIATAKAASGNNQQDLILKNEALEAQLVIYQKEAQKTKTLITSLQAAQKAMDFQEKYIPAAEDLLMRRQDLISKAEIANHHSAVNSVVMHLDASISQKERLISQIDTQHALIKSLQDEVNLCTEKLGYMELSMKTLSPASGLIAKGLTGSINHFIAQMNAIIAKVWTYPLEIKPVKVKEDETINLDYNFAFKVDDKDAGKDIVNGSGGQVEIFDLAFMLVSLARLGMDDSEIFLDEFAIHMDYVLRREASKMVSDLLVTSNFSQIFMISHYESSYSTLTNADITVLCPDNIQLPSELKVNTTSSVV